MTESIIAGIFVLLLAWLKWQMHKPVKKVEKQNDVEKYETAVAKGDEDEMVIADRLLRDRVRNALKIYRWRTGKLPKGIDSGGGEQMPPDKGRQ